MRRLLELFVAVGRLNNLSPIVLAIMATARLYRLEPDLMRALDDDFVSYGAGFNEDNNSFDVDTYDDWVRQLGSKVRSILDGAYDDELEILPGDPP